MQRRVEVARRRWRRVRRMKGLRRRFSLDAEMSQRFRGSFIHEFYTQMGRGADDSGQGGFDLGGGGEADLIEVLFGEGLFAGGFVEGFLGKIELLRAAEFLEAEAGDVDLFRDGVAAVDFDGNEDGRGDGERLSLGEGVVGEVAVVDLREVDAEMVFHRGLDGGRGGAAPG